MIGGMLARLRGAVQRERANALDHVTKPWNHESHLLVQQWKSLEMVTGLGHQIKGLMSA